MGWARQNSKSAVLDGPCRPCVEEEGEARRVLLPAIVCTEDAALSGRVREGGGTHAHKEQGRRAQHVSRDVSRAMSRDTSDRDLYQVCGGAVKMLLEVLEVYCILHTAPACASSSSSSSFSSFSFSPSSHSPRTSGTTATAPQFRWRGGIGEGAVVPSLLRLSECRGGGACKEGVDGVEKRGAGAWAEATEGEWKERGVRSLFWFLAECGVPALFLERLAIWLRRSYKFSKVLCLLTYSTYTIHTHF